MGTRETEELWEPGKLREPEELWEPEELHVGTIELWEPEKLRNSGNQRN